MAHSAEGTNLVAVIWLLLPARCMAHALRGNFFPSGLDSRREAHDTGRMEISSLDLTPRTRGRPRKAVQAEYVRELGPADFALLESGRGIKAPSLTRLRDRHHALARLLAQGKTPTEASIITGYDVSRISILKQDPTFQDLVSSYRSVEDGLMAEFTERAGLLSLTAMANLQEALEDDENPLPPSMQLEIAKTFADRTGHAPVQKSVQTNVNVELGSRMIAARQRLQNLRTVSSPPEGGPVANQTNLSSSFAEGNLSFIEGVCDELGE